MVCLTASIVSKNGKGKRSCFLLIMSIARWAAILILHL